MEIYVYLKAAGEGKIWGITPRTRIMRQLRELGIENVVTDLESVPHGRALVIIDAGFVFSIERLTQLVGQPDSMLISDANKVIAGCHVSDAKAGRKAMRLLGTRPSPDCPFKALNDGAGEKFDQRLRRRRTLRIEKVEAGNIETIESNLYGDAYRGVTDLVTKWTWPRPARWMVKVCVHSGIHPTVVTMVSLGLVAWGCWHFGEGQYGAGLSCVWLMSLLDTVDGKLARVTVRSSRLGHVLDHGIDNVYPPFAYLCWGAGLTASGVVEPFGLGAWFVVLMLGYLGGRMVESVFKRRVGRYGVFCWRPWDSYFRLIVARRNPCLLVLTMCWSMGRPDLGFVGVVIWTCVSTLILSVRVVQARMLQMREGPMKSWLAQGKEVRNGSPLAQAIFCEARSSVTKSEEEINLECGG